jgi:hypothetical protein
VSPRAGFDAALRSTARRKRAGQRLAEGASTYILSFFGGAALVLLWLKVSGLFGMRVDSATTFEWWFLAAGCALGGVLALLTQVVAGALMPQAVNRLGGTAGAREMRLVWGASAFPQVIAVGFLLPLDLLIVGPESFTSQVPADAVAAVWAAISVALAVALSIWSLCLFLIGTEVAAKIKLTRSLAAGAVGLVCLALVVLAFRFGAVTLAGVGTGGG